jgi:Fe-S oxidoreductase
MTTHALKEFSDKLYGCRFCPMCKPAGETLSITQMESHSTRARALLLWRIANEMLAWGPRVAELVYQSTLDSISEAWCVNHYPVSGYMLAARREAFAAGMAPPSVLAALARDVPVPQIAPAEVILLGGEAAQVDKPDALAAAVDALAQAKIDAIPVTIMTGAVAYALGAFDLARDQALRVVDLVQRSGAATVIADGSQTLWALRKIYPELGVTLPEGVAVVSLTEALVTAWTDGALQLPSYDNVPVFLHDSRAATLLADTLPIAEVIQPGYTGDETKLGDGEVFRAPRQLLDAMGMTRQYSVWSRALSKSSGADDGLGLTYPELAAAMAKARLGEAKRAGAEVLVAESLLDAAHLATFAGEFGLTVEWLPALTIKR